MQYFNRELHSSGTEEEWEIAEKSYYENFQEKLHAIFFSTRKLLKDANWNKEEEISFVNDEFHLPICPQLTFLLKKGDYLYIFQYYIKNEPIIESPSLAEEKLFEVKKLQLLYYEWDYDNDSVIQRLFLNNGCYISFKLNDFHWWKTKIEGQG